MPEGSPRRVLLITSDQQRVDSLPCYGLPFMRTPNLDRLAREGLVADHAVTPAPVCQPMRASLMTGLSPASHGVLSNHCWYPPSTPVWVRDVGDAGVRTAAIGKMHFHPWNDWGGFQDRVIAEDKRHHWRRDDYTLWLEAHGHRRTHPSMHPGYAGTPGAYTSPLPGELHLDSFIGDRGAEWLRANARAPFFAWVSFNSPHDPYDPPAELAGLYRDAPVPAPVNNPPVDPVIAERQRRRLATIGSSWNFEVDVGELDAPRVRSMREHYLATITLIDQQVGKLLAALEDAGALDDTLIVFTSDHGDALGDHGTMYKSQFYESMVRVPFLVRGPGVAVGARTDALIDLLDLVPTFLRRLQVDFGVAHHGQDLTGLLVDPAVGHRDEVVSMLAGGAMLRTRDWKLVQSADGLGELYDLASDPDETVNHHDDPDYGGVRADLSRRLTAQLLTRTADATNFTRMPLDVERERARLEHLQWRGARV